MKKIAFYLMLFAITFGSSQAQSTFTEKDRELLHRIEIEIAEIKTEQKIRAEENKKMLEQIDKRFEQVDKRFEQFDKRLELQHQLILGILATFTALSIALIGLMLWDRKTAAKPFEQKFLTIEKKVNEIKEVSPRAIQKEKIKINQVITVLRKMAENDKQLAEILKSINLL
jgi:phage-related minor tail protein